MCCFTPPPTHPPTHTHTQELYFRHLYARTQPSLRARCESWDNYCDLFGVILHGEGGVWGGEEGQAQALAPDFGGGGWGGGAGKVGERTRQ